MINFRSWANFKWRLDEWQVKTGQILGEYWAKIWAQLWWFFVLKSLLLISSLRKSLRIQLCADAPGFWWQTPDSEINDNWYLAKGQKTTFEQTFIHQPKESNRPGYNDNQDDGWWWFGLSLLQITNLTTKTFDAQVTTWIPF